MQEKQHTFWSECLRSCISSWEVFFCLLHYDFRHGPHDRQGGIMSMMLLLLLMMMMEVCNERRAPQRNVLKWQGKGGGQTVRHCVCEPRAGAIYIHTALLLLLLLLEKLWHDALLVRAGTERKTKWFHRRAEQSCRLRQRKGLIIMLSSSSSSSNPECASRGAGKMRSFASTRGL